MFIYRSKVNASGIRTRLTLSQLVGGPSLILFCMAVHGACFRGSLSKILALGSGSAAIHAVNDVLQLQLAKSTIRVLSQVFFFFAECAEAKAIRWATMRWGTRGSDKKSFPVRARIFQYFCIFVYTALPNRLRRRWIHSVVVKHNALPLYIIL